MINLYRLHLLQELKLRYQEGLVQRRRTLVYELLSSHDMPAVFGAFLDELWPIDLSGVYILDLDGIDVISPSAANALVEGVHLFIHRRKQPVVLDNARSEVLEGLKTARYVVDTRPILCALDEIGNRHFIGDLPDRLRDVLQSLEAVQQDGGSSASDLAEQSNLEVNKRIVNRFSVYLQELYNYGIVYRQKVGGLERADVERGWTYRYRPAYLDVMQEAEI